MKPKLVIDEVGTRRWFVNNRRHRTTGPAVEWANGDEWWYSNGKLHRTDGPAVEYATGDKFWWLNDTQYSFAKWLELTPVSEHQKLLLAIEYGEHV